MKFTSGFARRGPDRLTEELAAALSTKTAFDFNALFLIIYASLRARNATSGGEEMLRLRAYEKLQHLVQDGRVTKIGKEYRGIPAALNELIEGMAELARQTSVRSAAVAVPVPAVRARAKAAK